MVSTAASVRPYAVATFSMGTHRHRWLVTTLGAHPLRIAMHRVCIKWLLSGQPLKTQAWE